MVKQLVIGGGAVGLATAAYLSRTADVTLLCRTAHQAQVINDEGIAVTGVLGETTAAVNAVARFVLDDYDTIFVATKHADTREAVAQIAPHVDGGVRIVSLQNGITNAALLGKYFLDNRIVESVIPIGFTREGLNSSRVTFVSDSFIFGGEETLDSLVAQFEQSGLPARTSANFAGEQWKKYIFNCAYNALSGILNKPNAALHSLVERGIISAIVKEAYHVMQREGVTIDGLPTPHAYVAHLRSIEAQLGDHKSSLCQDLNAGKRTEIAILNGELTRRAEHYGVSAQANKTVTAYVNGLETGRLACATHPLYDTLLRLALAIEKPEERVLNYRNRSRSFAREVGYTTVLAAMAAALCVSVAPDTCEERRMAMSEDVRAGYTCPIVSDGEVTMYIEGAQYKKRLADVDPQWVHDMGLLRKK